MSIWDFDKFSGSKFAETVVYTPSGGAATSIQAVVIRRGFQKASGERGSDFQHYSIIVYVDRSDIATVTEQKDTIACNDLIGVSKTYRVAKMIASDAGSYKLGLT